MGLVKTPRSAIALKAKAGRLITLHLYVNKEEMGLGAWDQSPLSDDKDKVDAAVMNLGVGPKKTYGMGALAI